MPRQKRVFSGDALRTYQLAERWPIYDERCGGWQSKKIPRHYLLRRILHASSWPHDPPPIESLSVLPTDRELHVRGYLESRLVRYRIAEEDSYLPLRDPRGIAPGGWPYDRPKNTIFHSQPMKCIYSEIPAREDIYWFIKFFHKTLVTVGKKRIGIFTKNRDQSDPLRESLLCWEQQNRYRIFRIRKRHPTESPEQHFRRYAAAALRALGLQWPRKRSKRRKLWPQVFAQQLGLIVHVVDRQPR